MELYQPELRTPKSKAIKDDNPKATALVKDFVIKVIDQKLTPDMFTTEFGPGFLDRSERASAYLKRQGTFTGMELLERKDLENQSRLHHYRLIFSKEAVELLITLTPDNKIAAIEGRE